MRNLNRMIVRLDKTHHRRYGNRTTNHCGGSERTVEEDMRRKKTISRMSATDRKISRRLKFVFLLLFYLQSVRDLLQPSIQQQNSTLICLFLLIREQWAL